MTAKRQLAQPARASSSAHGSTLNAADTHATASQCDGITANNTPAANASSTFAVARCAIQVTATATAACSRMHTRWYGHAVAPANAQTSWNSPIHPGRQ